MKQIRGLCVNAEPEIPILTEGIQMCRWAFLSGILESSLDNSILSDPKREFVVHSNISGPPQQTCWFAVF